MATVRVVMAASGNEVCKVDLTPEATVGQLRKAIGNRNGLPLLRQTLLVGALELQDNSMPLSVVFPDAGEISPWGEVQLIVRPPEAILEEVRVMRQSLSRDNDPPIQEAIDRGLVPLYISYLEEMVWPDLQYEACWALTNIASGTTEQTRVVVEHGAVESFVGLLRCAARAVAEQAVWGLGNIAGDSPEFRDAVLSANAMQELITVFVEAPPPAGQPKKRQRAGGHRLVRNLCWSLANMCRGKPEPPLSLLQPLLQNMKDLLHISAVEDLAETCWACAHIADGPPDRPRCLVELGIVPRLVELLEHDSPSVRTPAMRAISNIANAQDADVQAVLDAGFLPVVMRLLRDGKTSIRKDACKALASILSGTPAQVQQVLSIQREVCDEVVDDAQSGPAGAIIQAVEEVLQADARNEVRNVAIAALTNAVCTASSGREHERRPQLLRLASSFLTVLLVFEHAAENEELTSEFAPLALQQVLHSIVCINQVEHTAEEIALQCKAVGIEDYCPLAITKYAESDGGQMLLRALREHEAASVAELAYQVLASVNVDEPMDVDSCDMDLPEEEFSDSEALDSKSAVPFLPLQDVDMPAVRAVC